MQGSGPTFASSATGATEEMQMATGAAATDLVPDKARKTTDKPDNAFAPEHAEISFASVVTSNDVGILRGAPRTQTASAQPYIDIPQRIAGVPAYQFSAVRPGADPGFIRAADGRSYTPGEITPSSFDRWKNGDDPVSKAIQGKLERTLDDISRIPDQRVRELALQGLYTFLRRGDSDHPEMGHGDNPQIKNPQVFAGTLDSVDRALEASKLNPLMGDADKASAARDLAIAQFLNNMGDNTGIKQGWHETCVLDGKIMADAAERPDKLAGILADAMTTQSSQITMPDGTPVRLDKSFMQDNAQQSAQRWRPGVNSPDQALDTRMFTGILANAVENQKGYEFEMDVTKPTNGQPNGDRLVDLNGRGYAAVDPRDGHTYLTANINQGIDQPFTQAGDSSRLQGMMGDGQVLATNAGRWNATDTRHIVDLSGRDGKDPVQTLVNLVHEHGSQQVGLSANILFGGGLNGGGHVTNIDDAKQVDGQWFFHVEDTNVTDKTSGWVSAQRLMAAINNDGDYLVRNPAARGQMVHEDMPILRIPQAERGHANPATGYTPPHGTMSEKSLQKADEAAKAKKPAEDSDVKPIKKTEEEQLERQQLRMAAALGLIRRLEDDERRKKEQQAELEAQREAWVRLSALNFPARLSA